MSPLFQSNQTRDIPVRSARKLRRILGPMPSKSSYILAMLIPLLFFMTSTTFAAPPKLAVLISVDQLRGDYLIEMESQFGEGGFRRLINQDRKSVV